MLQDSACLARRKGLAGSVNWLFVDVLEGKAKKKKGCAVKPCALNCHRTSEESKKDSKEG